MLPSALTLQRRSGEAGAPLLFGLGRTNADGVNGIVLAERGRPGVTACQGDELRLELNSDDVAHDHRLPGLADVERHPMLVGDLKAPIERVDAFGLFEDAGQCRAIHGADVSECPSSRQGRPALGVTLVLCCLFAGCGSSELRAARHAMDEGAFETAARHFRTAAEVDPADSELWLELARAELMAERPARARDAFARVAELRPGDPRPWVEIGFTWELGRRYDDARQSYLRAIEVAPESAYPHRVLGTRLLRWGHAEPAVEPLMRAVELAPRHAETWNALALALTATERLEEAEEVFRDGIEHHPSHLGLRLGLAALFINAGSFEPALEVYDEVLERAPGFGAAHVGRAILLHELGRADEAESAFEAAVEAEPGKREYRERLETYRALRAQSSGAPRGEPAH